MGKSTALALTLVFVAVLTGVAFAVVSTRAQSGPTPYQPPTTTLIAPSPTAGNENAEPTTVPPAARIDTSAVKPITGAVVYDPDDCGDTCIDAEPDDDDCSEVDDTSIDD